MAFSRNRYDECQYEQQLKRSTDIGSYQLFAPGTESTNMCYSLTGPIGSKADVAMPRDKHNLDLGIKAEAEAHIMNRVLPENNCNILGKNDGYKKFSNKLKMGDNCNDKVNTIDTRFTHPLDAYRGINTTEYHFNPYLHVNPQCQIHEWRLGTTTRLVAKDTYQIPEQKILDNGTTLPDSKTENKKLMDLLPSVKNQEQAKKIALKAQQNSNNCNVCGV